MNKNINTTLFILFITLLSFIIFQKKIKNNKENFESNTNNDNKNENENEIFKVSRPFCPLYDNNGNLLNVALLSRPFYSNSHWDEYEKIKDKFLILGISSYQEFPNQPENPKDGYDNNNKYKYITWVNMCDGWLHCFRNPDDYLPKTIPKIRLSESDFTDCHINKPKPEIKKIYDFLYVCHRDDISDCSNTEWVAYNKNLKLAEKCFSILCKKYNYKGLLVGRADCKLPDGCENNLTTTKKLDYYELQKKYDECKIVFLPNISDASPRVLTEGLCHGLPCLVNKNIVGGWQYINEQTGEFFNDENDFEEQFKKIMNNYDKYTPRKYFIENSGPISSGKKLKKFVYDRFSNQVNIPENEVEFITPEFSKKDFKECTIND